MTRQRDSTWSSDVVLFTDGHEPPSVADRARLQRYGVRLCQERVLGVAGNERGLSAVVVEGRGEVRRDALFLRTGLRAVSRRIRDLHDRSGCRAYSGRRLEQGD